MPELPEVEVTRRGVAPVLKNHTITGIFFNNTNLRYPISKDLMQLVGAKVVKTARRGKYILVFTTCGSLIIHLGMSGHLQIIKSYIPRVKHDHVEFMLDSNLSVRFNDARRFGMVVYIPEGEDPYDFPMIASLGPEPLEDSFTPEVLLANLKKRSCTIKQAIMNSKVVVGVGNIYASETLFLSAIDPRRKANSLTKAEATLLVKNIKEVLSAAIASGGTTIRDFEGADGKPGYFVQHLNVYGHKGKPCPHCGSPIEVVTLGQRSTYFCPKCQH